MVAGPATGCGARHETVICSPTIACRAAVAISVGSARASFEKDRTVVVAHRLGDPGPINLDGRAGLIEAALADQIPTVEF